MNILVTGGAGFIGSAVCRYLASDPKVNVVNLDKLTYAGNLASLRQIENHPNYSFLEADICDDTSVLEALRAHEIDVVMHLAAESHVDRSIDGPGALLRRISLERSVCSMRHLLIGENCRSHASRTSASTTSRQMKCLAICLSIAVSSPKKPRISRPRLIRLRRRPPIIWCAPGMKPMVCRLC